MRSDACVRPFGRCVSIEFQGPLTEGDASMANLIKSVTVSKHSVRQGESLTVQVRTTSKLRYGVEPKNRYSNPAAESTYSDRIKARTSDVELRTSSAAPSPSLVATPILSADSRRALAGIETRPTVGKPTETIV